MPKIEGGRRLGRVRIKNLPAQTISDKVFEWKKKLVSVFTCRLTAIRNV